MLDLIFLPEALNWLAFCVLIILSFFTSMLTASLGIGGGMLMLAALAQLIPVKAVIPIHGAVQLGSNSGRAAVMVNDVHWPYVFWFALGSILGALIGGRVVVSLPVDLLRAGLALFILFTVWGPSLVTKFASTKTLFLGGLLSTFLTMFIGATGPLVLTVIRTFNVDRLTLIATSAVCLVIQHALKIMVFGLLGFAFAPYIALITLMVFSGFVGTVIGKKLLLKINQQRFNRWLNIILSVLALRLLWLALL